MGEESIFLEALQKDRPEDRAAFLDQACAGDPALRHSVEQLLRAHERAGDFLQGQPAGAGLGLTVDEPVRQAPGTVIGPYKLLEQIGEGGFGVVYMAEQAEPVRRRVALKVLKPGMESRQVVARFEAERQALALMDHPNIATVLDGGTTAEGRPYFVMELVKGVPITTFCDKERLTTEQRLELFVSVCAAVQHAHQKGVIHRDIKPSNVLVTLHDGRPVVKVIDFGIAKALGEPLTNRTLFTGFAQMIGTPLYMSPEQAELSGLDVDTRSDVYSLGVLLYELLTGTTPFDEERLRQVSFDELRRIIREEEPPRPSARISTLGQAAGTVSAQRRSESRQLRRLFRGELDWVVMKALEKDRNRRYESPSAFAADVRRYLKDEPVDACPPSRRYRLAKALRRHRASVLTAAALAALLLAGTGTSLWLAAREAVAKDEARASERLAKDSEKEAKQSEAKARWRAGHLEKVNALLTDIFLDIDPRLEEKGGPGVAEQLSRRLERAAAQLDGDAIGEPLVVAALQNTLGNTLRELGHARRAIELLRKSHGTREAHHGPHHPDTLTTLNNLALAYQAAGRYDQALPLHEQVLARRREKQGPDHPDTLTAMNNLAVTCAEASQIGRALPLLEQALAKRRKKLGPTHPHTLNSMSTLAGAYRESGQFGRAVALLEEAWQKCKATHGPDHADTLSTMNNLAGALMEAGRLNRALPLLKEALAKRETKLGPDHPDTLTSMDNLAVGYLAAGERARGLLLFEQALDRRKEKHGLDHPATLNSMGNLAAAYQEAGRFDRGLPLHEQTVTKLRAKHGPDHRRTLLAMNNLAAAYREVGQLKRAVPLHERVLAKQLEKLGPDHPDTLTTLSNLGRAYQEAGQLNRALPLFEEALAKRQKKLGPDHPQTLNSMGSLALAYQAAGRLDRALPLFERVLARRQKTFGADHPRTLTSMNNLGTACLKAGQRDRARQVLEEALEKQKDKQGANHRHTLDTMVNLALVHAASRQPGKALPLLREALEKAGKRFGPNDPTTWHALHNLGSVLRDIGQPGRAVPLLETAWEGRKEKLGPLHPDTLKSLSGLALACRGAGQLPQAVRHYEQLRDHLATKWGADHPRTLSALNVLAVTHWQAKQLDHSVPLFEQLLAKHKAVLGLDHPNTLNTMANLAVNYADAGRPKEAMALLEDAVQRARKHPAPMQPRFEWMYLTLTVMYNRAGLFARSGPLFRHLLEQARRRFGNDRPETANALAVMGDNLLSRKKYADADRVLHECLVIRARTAPDAWTTFNTRSMLGAALVGQKKYAEAEPLLLAGYEGMKERGAGVPEPVGSLRLAQALERLVRLYDEWGKKDEAARWRKKLEALNASRPAQPPKP
jgi:serine/threonine protein kinase/tetratricopeptide (TPR) repeat protein